LPSLKGGAQILWPVRDFPGGIWEALVSRLAAHPNRITGGLPIRFSPGDATSPNVQWRVEIKVNAAHAGLLHLKFAALRHEFA